MPNTNNLPPLTVEFESGVVLSVKKIICVKKVTEDGYFAVMVWAEGTNPKAYADAFVLHDDEAERFWRWWCSNSAVIPPVSQSEERDGD